jgi:hypothetical protein
MSSVTVTAEQISEIRVAAAFDLLNEQQFMTSSGL